MDLTTRCREKLAYFRIKELKDVLGQMNQPKQGKKQDLVDRILSLISEETGAPRWAKRNSIGKEAVGKIIDDTYRKLQVHGAPDLAVSKSQSGSFNTNSNHNQNLNININIKNNNHVRPKEETQDSAGPITKVRCLCGHSYMTESMIKCEDPRCQSWQHLNCVVIPDKPMEGIQPELPSTFYCELCRLIRADPFWVTISHPLPAFKFTSCGLNPDGSNALQTVERTFQLSRADTEMLQRTDHDLQVWCMLLNDKVQFRMQWPQFADLQINGISVRVIPRPGSQLLGINGRDDGPVITTLSREGLNKICIGRADIRTFCFGIRVARKRSLQTVLDLIPKEANGERYEDALMRVKRCVGGGNASENDDSDSDLEVVAESVTVNLRCPMSGSRIKVAGRFKPCVHMACFDLDAFVELNQRSRKWQCPTCLKNYSLEKIVIDPYFNRITSMMKDCGEDVCEVEVKPDGSWRVKGEMENRDLARWHSHDGSLLQQVPQETKKPVVIGTANLVKQEATSEGYTGLKLGIKRNRNGLWEVKKPLEPVNKKPALSRNPFPGKPEAHFPRVLQGSGSSDSDGDDRSVNQDDNVAPFDLSLNNGHEFDSVHVNFGQGYNNLVEESVPPPPKDSDVIVLSDSEEDNPNTYEPGPSGEPSGFPFTTTAPNHTSFSGRFTEDPVYNGGTTNGYDFDINSYSIPSFQFFGVETDVPDQLALAPSNGYDLDGGAVGDGSGDAQDFGMLRQNHPEPVSLVDNPLAFGGEDPTLQIFLPTRPTGGTSSLQNESRVDGMHNGLHPDDWMSLSLAGGGTRDDESLSTVDLFGAPQQLPHQRTAKARMDRLSVDPGSVLLSMNGETNDESLYDDTSQMPSDYLFSHPRQPRSARTKPNCFSIDSDSNDSE